MSTTVSSTSGVPSHGAKTLQERLNLLLSKLATSIDLVKNWPSTDGDDASIHVKTTSKLILAILDIKKSLEKVEGAIKADADLQKALQDCPVPINLLDLMDHGNGLNPDCFSRGLLREALGQLAGLKRRKLALEMLGAAVQTGLNRRTAATAIKSSNKRQRSDDPPAEDGDAETATKKAKTEDTSA